MVIYIFKPERVFLFFLKKTTNPTLVYQQKSSTHTHKKKRLTFWLTVSTKHRHGLWYMLFQRDCSQKKKNFLLALHAHAGDSLYPAAKLARRLAKSSAGSGPVLFLLLALINHKQHARGGAISTIGE